MPAAKAAKAPPKSAPLSPTGRALWNSVLKKYELRDDETAVLLQACRVADRVAALDKEHRELGSPFMTKGSTGQDVVHPLVVEMRNQEAHLAGLLAKLKLPDDVEPAAGQGATNTNPARAAAAKRWKHGA